MFSPRRPLKAVDRSSVRRGPRGVRPTLERLEGRQLLARQVYASAFVPTAPNSSVSTESVRMDASNNAYVTGSFTGSVAFGGTTLQSAGANDIFLAKVNSNGTVAWARRMGSPNIADGDFGRGVSLDPTGNVIVTGFYSGQTDFGGGAVTPVGTRDFFVAKYDNAGNFMWGRSYGGVGFDLGQSVGTDGAGNVYTIGAFQGTVNFGGTTLTSTGDFDIFLMKFDPNGNPVWSKRMGGIGDDRGFSIAVDSAGNTYTTGIFSVIASMLGTPLTSGGATDIFAVKTDTNGNLVWAKGFGALNADTGTAITFDAGGSVYLTGQVIGAAKFGPLTLQNSANNGTGDAFLLKLNPDGNVAWVKGYGGIGADSGFHLAVDPYGFIYTTGIFAGTANFGSQILVSRGGQDVYWLKVHPNGNVDQTGAIGSPVDDQAYQVAFTGANARFTLVGNYGAPTTAGPTLNGPPGSFVYQLENPRPAFDFDNLRMSQASVFRPSLAQWYVRGANGVGRLQTTYGDGGLTDIPATGDYDGDGRADPAIYREGTAQWFAQLSSQNYTSTLLTPNGFGWIGVDIPVPGDYDGDGKTDVAVYRPTNAQWIVRFSSNNQTQVITPNGFGWAGVDLPVPGDYDGDGRTDPAVYRPTNANWFARLTSQNNQSVNLAPNGFGWAGVDLPAPGDYDGSGKTQLAVYRPSIATYFVRQPGTTARQIPFGGPNYLDLPLQAPIGALKRFNLFPPGTFGALPRSASLITAPAVAAMAVVPNAEAAAAPIASPFSAQSSTTPGWSARLSRRFPTGTTRLG